MRVEATDFYNRTKEFKESLYSDNLHNYNYDDLIKDELVEDFIKQNIDNRLSDKRPRNMSNFYFA